MTELRGESKRHLWIDYPCFERETTEFTVRETKSLTHEQFAAQYVGSGFEETYTPEQPVVRHEYSGPNRRQRRAMRKAERQRRGQ